MIFKDSVGKGIFTGICFLVRYHSLNYSLLVQGASGKDACAKTHRVCHDELPS